MGIINTRKDGFAGKQKLSHNVVRSAIESTSAYSFESAEVIQQMRSGSFDPASLNPIQKALSASFESALGGDNINPVGVALASVVVAAGQQPSDLLRMLTTESKLPKDGDIAMAIGSEYDSVYSPESYDNQNLTDHLSVSIGVNYQMAQADTAMAAWYRPIPLTPDTGYVSLEVPNLFVQNTLRHADDGTPSDFGFRRVIDSAIDASILANEATTIIPGYTAKTKDLFVDEALVEPFEKTEGRRTVMTSALAVGKTQNLFGLGQTDSIARSGQADFTEALDRDIGISDLYLALGDDVLRFDVKGMPFSRFIKTGEQGNKTQKLSFPVTSLTITADSKAYNGSDLTEDVFDTIASGKYRVRLKFDVHGSVDLERGNVKIDPAAIEVMSITNEFGELIDLTSGVGKTIVEGLANLEVIGWYPDARLTNSNHRHLGLLLNVRTVKNILKVSTRAPIFVPYPLGEERDQTILDNLSYAASRQINSNGIGAMIAYHERLERLTGGMRGEMVKGDYELNSMVIEGPGRHLINPYVRTVEVDLTTAQSTETLKNVANGQEVLRNTIRSLYFDIMQTTNYENACRYMDGGQIVHKWKLLVVTGPKIEQFLTLNGDPRVFGENVPFELKSDIDMRLRDCMYLTLVRESEGIDPLSAGCMLIQPTLVSTITATRDGRPGNEAVVQPRYQHHNLLPIVVKLEVSGVDELLEKALSFNVTSNVTVNGVVQTESQDEPTNP